MKNDDVQVYKDKILKEKIKMHHHHHHQINNKS